MFGNPNTPRREAIAKAMDEARIKREEVRRYLLARIRMARKDKS